MYKHFLKYFGIDPTSLLASAIIFSVDVPSHPLFTNTVSALVVCHSPYWSIGSMVWVSSVEMQQASERSVVIL